MSIKSFKDTAKTIGSVIINISKAVLPEYLRYVGVIDILIGKRNIGTLEKQRNRFTKLANANTLFQTASIGYFNELSKLRAAAIKATLAKKDALTDKSRDTLRNIALYVEQIEVTIGEFILLMPDIGVPFSDIKQTLSEFRTKISHAVKTVVGGHEYNIASTRPSMTQLNYWRKAAATMKPADRRKYKQLIENEVAPGEKLKELIDNNTLAEFIMQNTAAAKQYVAQLQQFGAVQLTNLIDYYRKHRSKYLPSGKTSTYEIKTNGDTISICVQDDIANIRVDMKDPSQQCFMNHVIAAIQKILDALNRVDRKIIHKMAKSWKKHVAEVPAEYTANYRKLLKDKIINKLNMLKMINPCDKLKPIAVKPPQIKVKNGDELDTLFNYIEAYYEAENSILDSLHKIDDQYRIVITDLNSLFVALDQLTGPDVKPCIRIAAILPLAMIQIQYHKGEIPDHFKEYAGTDLMLVSSNGKINKKNLDKYISTNIC